jgi:hypothetical protein
VANKGLRNRRFCDFAHETVWPDGMPPRVFLPKSAELLENTGVDFFGERKERTRAGKSIKGKGIARIGTGFGRRRRVGQRAWEDGRGMITAYFTKSVASLQLC